MTAPLVSSESRTVVVRGRASGGAFGTGPTIALIFLVLVIACGVLAPVLAPHDPLATDVTNRLAGPSSLHWLGTDPSGRDVLSRILYGGTSALVGMAIAMTAMIAIGVPWGLLTGYFGGAVDQAGMRLADAFLAIPGLAFAVAITGALGRGQVQSMVAVGVVFAPTIAILLRSSIVPIRQSEYVQIATSLGTPGWRAAFRHVLPNAMAPMLVQLCSFASFILLIQAGLAFLGLGVQPPDPSWGKDLADVYIYFSSAPLGTVVPGLTIVAVAFAIGRVGDGIRAVLRTE